jgi:hypothetical protein
MESLPIVSELPATVIAAPTTHSVAGTHVLRTFEINGVSTS